MNYKTPFSRCAISLFLCVVGCSATAGPPPSPVQIDELIGYNPALKIEMLSTDPLLYRIGIHDEQSTLFATGVKECGVRDFVPSQATTRQLLVGFDNAQMTSQQFVEKGNQKLLRSEFSATLDAQPIDGLAYTARDKNCVTDFAFWRPHDEGSLRQLVESKVVPGLTVHD